MGYYVAYLYLQQHSLPPEGDRDYFLIGTDDVATDECIDFILSYTGIPRELAYIGRGFFQSNVLVIPNEEADWPILEEYESNEVLEYGCRNHTIFH